MHLALTWEWDNSYGTSFVGYRNNVSELTVDQEDSYLEYSTAYSNNWACETDSDSSGSSSNVRYFSGFIYQVAIANYLITPSTLFEDTCSGYSGCNSCPTNGECLSLCPFDEYPNTDGTCGSCLSSCSEGCVRAQNCYLCFDFHCETCTNWPDGACTDCEAVAEGTTSCTCTTNFNGDQYTRSNTNIEEPCCASGCYVCDDVRDFIHCSQCLTSHFEQPSTTTAQEAYKTCFNDCPSGYTKNFNVQPGLCTLDRTNIVYYDLTYIIDTIDNQFAPGTLDAISNVDTSAQNVNFGNGFTATKPYKMRGRYGNGTNTGVYIPGLNLHHTFTVFTWIYAENTTGTLFSKDKGSYTTLDSENLLNLEISAGQLSAKLYTGSTDNFNGSCITTASVVSTQVWVSVSYVFTFNGEGTDVNIYTNASSVLSYNAAEVFLEDKDTYKNAFLMAASTESSGSEIPENVFQGYMYRFGLWHSVDFSLIEDEVDVLSNCANCSHVSSSPTHCATNAGSDSTS